MDLNCQFCFPFLLRFKNFISDFIPISLCRCGPFLSCLLYFFSWFPSRCCFIAVMCIRGLFNLLITVILGYLRNYSVVVNRKRFVVSVLFLDSVISAGIQLLLCPLCV